MWKWSLFLCLLWPSFWVEETQISIALKSMSDIWRTSLEGLQTSEGSDVWAGGHVSNQSSAVLLHKLFLIFPINRPYWTITIEHLGRNFFFNRRCIYVVHLAQRVCAVAFCFHFKLLALCVSREVSPGDLSLHEEEDEEVALLKKLTFHSSPGSPHG